MSAPTPQHDVLAWWENQIDLHPPKNERVAKAMDKIRREFKTLGLVLIGTLPPGPDLTVALRALKEASQAAIGTIACNQDHWED